MGIIPVLLGRHAMKSYDTVGGAPAGWQDKVTGRIGTWRKAPPLFADLNWPGNIVAHKRKGYNVAYLDSHVEYFPAANLPATARNQNHAWFPTDLHTWNFYTAVNDWRDVFAQKSSPGDDH